MAQIAISSLPPLPPITGSATPLGTDLIPGVDTSDLAESLAGTTKKYTRAASFNYELEALGLTTYTAVLAASTGALTATYSNGTLGVGATLTNAGAQVVLTLDGVTLTLGDRVLIKDQVSTFQNGIYFVSSVGSTSSNWILIRALDYNQAADIVQYGVMLVNAGTVNQSTLYQEVSPGPFLMGTTAITFSRFQAGAISLPVPLSAGGTQASLTANNGGIFYSNATTGAILSGTPVAGRILQSGASSAPAWSSATYPAITNINRILYSSAANTVGQITTALNGILVTDGSGVPSIGNTVGAGLTMPSVTFSSTTGIVGTTTNDSAPAGSVGYFLSDIVDEASAVSLTTATPADVLSINLDAGDWDVWGNISFIPAATTNVVQARAWISDTSATLPDAAFYSGIQNTAAGVVPASTFGFCVPCVRVSVAAPTTYYLSCTSAFSVDTLAACGALYARVRR
jgi:hypothetical protein